MKIYKFITLILIATLISCNQPISDGEIENNITENPDNMEWKKNANIYEVNIRQYTKEGTFKAFENHLERLSDMGVDILWIMPINPIGKINQKGSLGSYYSISNYTEVNPEFGSLEDFNDLVTKAKSLGMNVIIDWVANHTSWDNVWTVQHPEWFEKDSNDSFISPYDWTDVIALNYENKEVWKGMQDAMIYWIENTEIAGFRCDVADLVPTEFWNETRVKLDSVRPVFMLAEAETPALQITAFDMGYSWKLHHLMNDIAKGEKSPAEIAQHLEGQDSLFEDNDFRMLFTSNHDENSWNGTTEERMGASKNTFAALSYILPGMPLIYSGQEASLNRRLKFFEKDEIDWSNINLGDFYKKLNTLKHNNPALWNGDNGGEYSIIENNANDKIFSIARIKDDNTVYFIANFSADKVNTNVIFNEEGKEFTNAMDDSKIILNDTMNFDLEPWEYYIFVK